MRGPVVYEPPNFLTGFEIRSRIDAAGLQAKFSI